MISGSFAKNDLISHMDEAQDRFERVLAFSCARMSEWEKCCRHVSNEIVRSRDLCALTMDESCHTYEYVMSRIWMSKNVEDMSRMWSWCPVTCVHSRWMSHVTPMNESCHTYGWVMSHVWMCHVTHMDESCHTYEYVMSRIWMRKMLKTCLECDRGVPWLVCTHYGWVMSHLWMRHVTHINESCHTYEWVMIVLSRDVCAAMDESCLTYECGSFLAQKAFPLHASEISDRSETGREKHVSVPEESSRFFPFKKVLYRRGQNVAFFGKDVTKNVTS